MIEIHGECVPILVKKSVLGKSCEMTKMSAKVDSNNVVTWAARLSKSSMGNKNARFAMPIVMFKGNSTFQM